MVQWSQRLWLHSALDGGGRFRPLLRHPGERLPVAERRRDGGVRPAQGPERLPGGERRPRVVLLVSQDLPSRRREGLFMAVLVHWPFSLLTKHPTGAASHLTPQRISSKSLADPRLRLFPKKSSV